MKALANKRKSKDKLPISPNTKNNAKRIVDVSKDDIKDVKPCVGITYLDKNRFGLKDFFKAVKDDKQKRKDFEEFLEAVRGYKNRDEVIENHCPRVLKNKDKDSQSKIKAIKNKYNIDATDMVHLHCKRQGKGEFVLHGFWLENIFEVVWLDCNHDLHKV